MAKACADRLSSQRDSSGPRAGTILWVQYEDLKRLLGVPWSLDACSLGPSCLARIPLFSGPLLAAEPQASLLGRVSQQRPGEQRREGQLGGEGTGGVLRCSGLESGGAPKPAPTLSLLLYCIPCCEQPCVEPSKFMA